MITGPQLLSHSSGITLQRQRLINGEKNMNQNQKQPIEDWVKVPVFGWVKLDSEGPAR